MENTIKLLLICVLVVPAASFFKVLEMERYEKVKIREFEMGRDPKPKDTSLLFRKLRLRGQRGNLTNCGSTEFKFSIQWEPVILNTQGTATIYWDLVAPCDMDTGNAHIDVFLPEIPDSPIFSLDQKGTCADIKKAVPILKCPIKKNDEIKGQMVASDLTRLPTGNYTIAVKVTNAKGELFACGKASVELTP